MTHQFPYSIKRHGTTLEQCEHEPVQTPGCIQAHGVLLVLRPGDLKVLQVSENCQQWLGLSPQELLGQQVALAVGEEITKKMEEMLLSESLEKAPLYFTTLKPRAGRNDQALHLSLHTLGGLVLLEMEETGPEGEESEDSTRIDPDYYGLVRKTLTRFQDAQSLRGLAHEITEEVRRITKLDRVMVYRFHADASGEIIAETKRADQISWLGWRYPAHDIPQPAREIFKKIWSRPVPDVRAELHEMVPLLNPETQAPLDLTYSSLRGASIMYTEYLDNMGVRAALTLPLIRDGELWGLIACHHDTPKLISYRVRTACEFLARAASKQLRSAEEREETEYRLRLEAANYALISKVALKLELSAFTEGETHLASGLDCGGAAILYEEEWNKTGHTPSPEEIIELSRWVLTQPECREGSTSPLLVTDHLCALYPPAAAYAHSASGLMAFCFSHQPLGLVIYFKPETLQTLTWAGNPHELPIVAGPNGPRLSPRKSFEVWRETVRNRSMPWKRLEIDSVLKLRGLIIDLVVARADEIKALRSELASSRTKAAQAEFVANERFRIAVEAGDLGTWEFAPATGQLEWSARCKALFGLAPETQVDYATFLEAVHPEDREKTDRQVQQALEPDSKGRFDTEYRTNAARPEDVKWLRAAGKTILNDAGQVMRFVGTVQDITAMVHAREGLAERRDELQDLVDQRTVELRNTIGELEAFSYSISHDMRSPLRAMQGFSQALLLEYNDKLDAEGKDYLKRIERGAKRLDMLIQDVLSYSRVAKSELTMHAIHLESLIDETVRHLPELQEPNATLHIAGPLPSVMGHDAFLSQILSNLLGNAVKFHMPGAKPIITVSAENLPDKIKLRIKDNGLGIDPSHHRQIFEIFGRVYPGKQYEGTGIGLAIVKKAVQRMGGEIGLDSTLGKGSEFWFTLNRP